MPAGSLTARPIVTSASATSATIAPVSAGNRTRRAGVHARARVMAAATIATTVPRTGDGTVMSVKGRNSESSRDTKAGTTSPRMNDRTTAIVASTCRRSHTSATANSSSPTAGGRTYASISNVQDEPSSHSHSARVAAANAGQANSRRGAAASATPAARVSGTRPAASVSGPAQPRVTDAPANPSAATARMAQRKSYGTSARAKVAVTSAPRSAARRTTTLVGGRHRRARGTPRPRHPSRRPLSPRSPPPRHRPAVRAHRSPDGSVRTGRSERTQPDHDGGGTRRGESAPARRRRRSSSPGPRSQRLPSRGRAARPRRARRRPVPVRRRRGCAAARPRRAGSAARSTGRSRRTARRAPWRRMIRWSTG